ncbi:hypothetical protein EOI86_05645 [Hwanghaeella grinnelliae]|uniref:DUF4136 domain-containing protein n=1 Tax=Hwanghaeella grinnelliae TaxID=2500179 RepID=A0A3S2Z9Q8_9PROT|nr:hypothetical protein [Hwanghaeella grinnelliae]RVU38754.1 hypothetical protein EOI86_05645 [Hwanghaeella grinnelliae]
MTRSIRHPRLRFGEVRFFFLAGLLALAACAHPTPYQAEQDGQGFSDRAIEDDRFRVTFAGNFLTTRETVEDYLLYRAAEVTLQRGYDYFLIVEKDTERKTTAFTHFFDDDYPFSTYGYSRGDPLYDRYFDRFGPSYVLGTTQERHRYTAFAEIQLRRGEKPDGDPNAYDAREVQDRLAPKLVPPAPE